MKNDVGNEKFPFYPKMPKQERIEVTLCCVCAGLPVPIVKRVIARGCKVTLRMADFVIRDALSAWKDTISPFKLLRCRSIAWYHMQLMSPNCPLRLKFRARKELDTHFGLYDRDAIKREEEEEKAQKEADEAQRIVREREAFTETVMDEVYGELPSSDLEVIAKVDRLIQKRVDARFGVQSVKSPEVPKVKRRRKPGMVFSS